VTWWPASAGGVPVAAGRGHAELGSGYHPGPSGEAGKMRASADSFGRQRRGAWPGAAALFSAGRVCQTGAAPFGETKKARPAGEPGRAERAGRGGRAALDLRIRRRPCHRSACRTSGRPFRPPRCPSGPRTPCRPRRRGRR